jgi:hypothetical protein
MLSKSFKILTLLFVIAAIAGCEGEQGPAGPRGPAGPAGPSMVLCTGEIDASGDPVEVVTSWPDDVDVSVAIQQAGIWNVTLTGDFPATQGTILTTNVDSNAGRSLTGYITSWSETTITFRVGIWHIINSEFTNGEFSFVVMAVTE